MYAILRAIQASTVTGATKDILVLGMRGQRAEAAFLAWVFDATNGVKAKLGGIDPTYEVAVGADISTVDFSKYKMIYIPSSTEEFFPNYYVSGGILCSALTQLAGRKADFANYVNNLGGSIVSYTEAG